MEIGKITKWIGETRGREIIVLISLILGVSMLVLNFIFLRDVSGMERIFSLINVVGAMITVGPSIVIKYREYQRQKEIERRFPGFLRDVTEATKAGMTLPEAIKQASENEYGALTPHVRKMASQMDWGVPFEEVLERFADRVGSEALRRTVSTIIETHRSGGEVSEVLETVGESVVEMERIKSERKSHVYSQMITGYTIYFVFLGVMIGLQRFLIPSLTTEGIAMENGAGLEMGELTVVYEELFRNLVIIQGLFSGLAIGKMSAGTIIAGLQHVVVLIAIGYTAFFVLI
ncbi:MAG: type II secretion system F family protein [Candidatus Aenigmatarchaeota archaeon]